METLAEELDPTEDVVVSSVTVTCTHVSIGFTYQEWAEFPICTYRVIGILDDDGKFVAIGPPQYAQFSQQDYADLLGVTGLVQIAAITDMHDTIYTQNVADRLGAYII